MKRLTLLLLLFACDAVDPRGQCVNQYVDHYDYTTRVVYDPATKTSRTQTTSDPVYECDVWVKVSNDSVLVTTKVGRDRVVEHAMPERTLR